MGNNSTVSGRLYIFRSQYCGILYISFLNSVLWQTVIPSVLWLNSVTGSEKQLKQNQYKNKSNNNNKNTWVILKTSAV